ncbi:MAG: glutamyl-tRNA reductase [Prevotella sp.]|nr:glutamyl-tRNA reductase [Prevotella sp.]
MIQYQSINHLTTSLTEREEYFSRLNRDEVGPSVLLQTCNRVELYYGDGEIPDAVARHLFRVVCGLESAIIGERAVQGQVKEAYLTARQSGIKLSTGLHKLFECALQIGKRVRTETQISQGAVSHSLAAIEIIEQQHVNLVDAHITIIGVNKLTEDIIKFLKNKGAKVMMLANRTEEKARRMAAPYGIDVRQLDEKCDFLQETDILVSATSAPHAVVYKEDLNPSRPLLAIDLAFPRDIDPAVADLELVTLYNLQDVERKVQDNIAVREEEVQKAELMIEEEIGLLRETMARRRSHQTIRIVARGSRLSRLQVEEVMQRLPEVPYNLRVQASLGDKNQTISLLNGEAPDDIFTRELDLALLKGEADVAIHSAKDLPEQLNGGLEVIALYEAFDKTDSLVSRDNLTLAQLPVGSRIGTSSPLRRRELQALRPDLEIVGIRGCIEDRVRQVRAGQIDAAIVATCALKRLGMEGEIAEVLPFATHPMQGRLAVTARKGRNDLKAIFSKGSIL